MPRSVKIPLWPWNQKFLETPLIIEPVHTSQPHAQGTDKSSFPPSFPSPGWKQQQQRQQLLFNFHRDIGLEPITSREQTTTRLHRCMCISGIISVPQRRTTLYSHENCVYSGGEKKKKKKKKILKSISNDVLFTFQPFVSSVDSVIVTAALRPNWLWSSIHLSAKERKRERGKGGARRTFRRPNRMRDRKADRLKLNAVNGFKINYRKGASLASVVWNCRASRRKSRATD